MNVPLLDRRVVWSFAVAWLLAGPVSAQQVLPPQRPAGPFAGLFGADRPEHAETLDFNGSAYGGYEDNLVDEQYVASDPRLQTSGATAGLSGGLTYKRLADHARFWA